MWAAESDLSQTGNLQSEGSDSLSELSNELCIPVIMIKTSAISFGSLRALMVLPVLAGIVFANARPRQPSPALSLAAYQSPPTAQTSAAKVKLNGEEVGTTADTSVLARRLTEIFERRREKGPFQDELARSIFGSVFIRADNDALFSEVIRVIEAVRSEHGILFLPIEADPARAGKASGDPVITDYSDLKGEGSYEIHSRTSPHLQMLVVTVGNLGSPRGELISGGIRLFIPEFTLRLSAKHSIPKEFTVIEVFKDKQYVIDEKSIAPSALRGELRARLKERIDKRVVILTLSDSDIRWSSFMEAANAAREAGAGMIQHHNLTP
jgi:biopolymer transport protein ExbD